MKSISFLSSILILIFFACENEKDQVPVPEDTKVLIDGESISPTESSAFKTGNSLILTFKADTKNIKIITNDTIAGTYNVLPKSSKSVSGLTATIEYFDGSTKYIGNGGTFIITKNEGGIISGLYNAKVISDKGEAKNIQSGSFVSIQTISIIETESAINDTLELCYSKLHEYIEFSYIFDAVYSNLITAPNNSWTEIYEHTQSPENENILILWSKAFDIIYKTNLILQSSEIVISDELTRNSINAQAKSIRAYLFYNLMTWFGEIPIETDIPDTMNLRSSIPEVLVQIKEDATSAVYSLPMKWPADDSFRIPKSFMLGLLARISLTDFILPDRWPPLQQYLYSTNCDDAIIAAQQILSSGIYVLDNTTNNFSETNTEIIWGFEKTYDNEFNSIFKKGSYIPVLRLTEMCLIISEALCKKGNSLDAISYINLLNSRSDNQLAISITTDEILPYWNSEFSLEGSRFITLRRFNRALEVVQNNPRNILLPIPLTILIKNPYLTQNIGY
jgi:starch-binding outer membrane protein, SusD/RagB family